ncbi:hypothetical protein MNV49_005770 [Pseudohyphozyma bogoriensis]|nr:hypothetical protein MNV49_005770 [Pseudohyphozyma bogoriensis]
MPALKTILLVFSALVLYVASSPTLSDAERPLTNAQRLARGLRVAPPAKFEKSRTGKVKVRGFDGQDYGYIRSAIHDYSSDTTGTGTDTTYTTTPSIDRAINLSLQFTGSPTFNINPSRPFDPALPFLGARSVETDQGGAAHLVLRDVARTPHGTLQRRSNLHEPRSQVFSMHNCHHLSARWFDPEVNADVETTWFLAKPETDESYIGATTDWDGSVSAPTTMPIPVLPDEVLVHILSLLDLDSWRTLLDVALVSKRFCFLARTSAVWRPQLFVWEDCVPDIGPSEGAFVEYKRRFGQDRQARDLVESLVTATANRREIVGRLSGLGEEVTQALEILEDASTSGAGWMARRYWAKTACEVIARQQALRTWRQVLDMDPMEQASVFFRLAAAPSALQGYDSLTVQAILYLMQRLLVEGDLPSPDLPLKEIVLSLWKLMDVRGWRPHAPRRITSVFHTLEGLEEHLNNYPAQDSADEVARRKTVTFLVQFSKICHLSDGIADPTEFDEAYFKWDRFMLSRVFNESSSDPQITFTGDDTFDIPLDPICASKTHHSIGRVFRRLSEGGIQSSWVIVGWERLPTLGGPVQYLCISEAGEESTLSHDDVAACLEERADWEVVLLEDVKLLAGRHFLGEYFLHVKDEKHLEPNARLKALYPEWSVGAAASSSTTPTSPPDQLTDEPEEDEHETEHDPWSLARAHILSPHTRTQTQNSTPSISSSFSFSIPTKRAFHRAHLFVQFPISALVCILSGLGLYLWKREVRWVELGLGAAAWLASETIKHVVFDLFVKESVDKEGVVIKGTGRGLPTIIHAVVQECLRLGALRLTVALLPDPVVISAFVPSGPHKPAPPPGPRRPLPPLDTLFFSALWVSLGWALVEVVWGSRDFWKRMQLYDDVLDDGEFDVESDASSFEETDAFLPTSSNSRTYGATALTTRGPQPPPSHPDDKLSRSVTVLEPEAPIDMDDEEVDEEVEARIKSVERMEVEAQLGVPLYDIPVMVVVIWRLDAILLSLVLTLVLSLPFRTSAPSLVAFPLWPTFAAVCLVHSILSCLWVLRIPSVGLPSLSYATLVVLVMLTFGALGAWGALE